MNNIIGVDLGGTHIKGGRIFNSKIETKLQTNTMAHIGGQKSLEQLYGLIDKLIKPETNALGIGVPSVVDRHKGIIYNVQNIKNWDEVHLKSILEEKYSIPVYVDNDANCFAMGEKIFGKGRNFQNFVGITIGTGLGGGIIQNNHLLNDANCGSGEFGELPYLDSIIEAYCSSGFFTKHGTTGYDCYVQAQQGDLRAIELFSEFGRHMATLIKMIVLTIDPEAIIMGGSIAKAYPHFEPSLKLELTNFVYPKSIKRLSLLTSDLSDSGIKGAAALCM